jgi:hypothetical protein
MALVIGLAVLMALIALAGYYIGPGLGYYGAGSFCLVLLLVILYRVFGGGPRGKGIVVHLGSRDLPSLPEKVLNRSESQAS